MITHIVALSLLILAVIILRGIFRSFASPKIIYALWLAVAIKLFLPISLFYIDIPSLPANPDLSFSTTSDSEVVTTDSKPQSPLVTDDRNDIITDPLPYDTTADFYEETTPALPYEPDFIQGTENDTVSSDTPPVSPITADVNIVGVLRALWLIGSVVTAGIFALSWLNFTVKVRGDREFLRKVNNTKVYISENAGGSCLAGFIPSVYLPPEVAYSENADLVVAHEYTHLRHFDYLWSALRTAAIIMFWWNPLVWAAAVLSKQDAELACDYSVTSKLNEESRLKYARIIVETVPKKRLAVGLTGGQIRERIIMITKNRKTTAAAAIFALALTLFFTGCSFIGLGNDKSPDFYENLTYAEGLYYKANDRDHMIIIDNETPCIVTGNISFEGLSNGDKVRFGAKFSEKKTFPIRAEIFSFEKLHDGALENISTYVLAELTERGWAQAFNIHADFAKLYREAEWLYALFTGYGEIGKITLQSQAMKYNNIPYDKVSIEGISSLAGLREKLSEYFDTEIVDMLMETEVQEGAPLYLEQKGNLYRFGGYVSQYDGETEITYQPLDVRDGIHRVKITATKVLDLRAVSSDAVCSYRLDEDEKLIFTKFPYMGEIVLHDYSKYPIGFTTEPLAFIPPEAEDIAARVKTMNEDKYVVGYISNDKKPCVYYGVPYYGDRFAHLKCAFEEIPYDYSSSEIKSINLSPSQNTAYCVIWYKNPSGEIIVANYEMELRANHELGLVSNPDYEDDPSDNIPTWKLTAKFPPRPAQEVKFDPDTFGEHLPNESAEVEFWHKIFSSDAYLYFCSIRGLTDYGNSYTNEPPKDFVIYYTDDYGELVKHLDIALPENLEYDTVVPIHATSGGGSLECVFYLKLTNGDEVFYVSFDNFDWGENHSYLDFTYRGVVSDEALKELMDRFPEVFGKPYTEDSGIFTLTDNRYFIPPKVYTHPTVSQWGKDKMLYICHTYDKAPLIYYSALGENGKAVAAKTELPAPDFDYKYSKILDILYQNDANTFITIRYTTPNGWAKDITYRGYGAKPTYKNGKADLDFTWDFITITEPTFNNELRGQFIPTDYYNFMPDRNAHVLFHMKTMANCYFFCEVGNDFAVYYRSYDNDNFKKLDIEIAEQYKYDKATPISANSGEYANGVSFVAEYENAGSKYYLRFSDVYGIGITVTRVEITDEFAKANGIALPSEIVITDIADFEKLNYDGIYSDGCYDLVYKLFSGKSGIAEFDGLKIKDYKLTRPVDVMYYTPTLYLDFTVTGNSMPISLPAGEYHKVISSGYDLYLYDAPMPETAEEFGEQSNKTTGSDKFGDNISVKALRAFFSYARIWDIPENGKWNTENIIIPASYLPPMYSKEDDGYMRITYDDLVKLLSEKFGITLPADIDKSNLNRGYLDRSLYDAATDTVIFADTRGTPPIFQFLSVEEKEGFTEVVVQFFADTYHLLPSHKVKYIMRGDAFFGHEVIEESKYEPSGFVSIS